MHSHILFIIADLECGGAEKTFLRLANRLVSRSRVSLALMRLRGSMLEKLDPRITLHDLGGPLRVFYRLPLLVKKIRPKAILSTFWDINVIVLLLRPLFPGHVRICVREALCPNAAIKTSSFPQLTSMLYRTLYARADGIIVMTASMRRTLLKHAKLDDEKICVISNSVSIGGCPDAVPNRENSGNAGVELISIGRLTSQKGYDILLTALPRVISRHPDVHLTIIGDGPSGNWLKSLAINYGIEKQVTFVKRVSNPLPYLCRSDFYVLSSRYEGQSNAMLESMCAGLPVVAFTDGTGADECVIDNVSGFLVTQRSTVQLADTLCTAIDRLSTLKKSDLGSSARQTFSFERQSLAYYSFLIEKECLSTRVDPTAR